VLAAAIRSMYGTASKIFTSAAVARLGNAFPTTRSNNIAPDTVRSPWSTSVKFLFAPIQSVSLSLAFVEIRSVPQVRLSDRGGGHCRCDQKAASGTKSAWLISSGRLFSRSVRLAHRPTIAPSLYQIWPTAGTKFGFDLRCKSRFSNGFTASALKALPSSIAFRFAPARGRTAAGSYRSEMRHAAHSRRDGGLAVRNDAACRPNQGRANAIIGRRESADFRGDPGAVTDAPGLGSSAS
jgi:hypothetical protein